MNRKIEKKADLLLEKSEHRKSWHRFVKILAVVVILITVGLLTVPAITMEKKPICGIEEHKHGPECYKEEKKLICEIEDSDFHEHTEECYKENKKLICGKEECEGHTHGEQCYAEKEVLSCGLEEDENHKHDENCYTKEKVLICEQEEKEAHKHDESCYVIEKELICGKEEKPKHEHTEECYEITKVLVCEKPEHKHTEECFEQSDPGADVENSADWEQTISGVVLTGDWDKDVIAVARTQIGYMESKKNFIWDDKGEKLGYSRYGEWYGSRYGNWCAMFVSFCMNYAEIPEEGMPYEAGCQRWIEKLSELKLYKTDDTYEPVSGDLVFFDFDQNGISEHMGLIEEILHKKEDGSIQIKTIEGNTGDGVGQNIYEISDSSIMGYGTLLKAQEEYNERKNQLSKELKLRFHNKKLKVTVKITGLKEPLSKNTELTVKEITEKNYKKDYNKAIEGISEETIKKNRELRGFNIFDFELKEKGKNVEISPDADVSVEFEFKKPLFKPGKKKKNPEFRTFMLNPEGETRTAEAPEGEVQPAVEPEGETQTAENPEEVPETADPTTGTGEPASASYTEVKGTYSGENKGLTKVSYMTKGIQPVAVFATSQSVTGKFWKVIRNKSELNDQDTYLIVSAEGNYVLVNNGGNTAIPNYKAIEMEPVKGNPDYYKIDEKSIPGTAKMKYAGILTKTMENGGFRLDPAYQVKLFMPALDGRKQLYTAFNTGEYCWSIHTQTKDGTKYFLNCDGEIFKGNGKQKLFTDQNHQYSKTSDMLILKSVDTTLSVPNDAVPPDGGMEPGTATKPNYPAYRNVSGAKTGIYQEKKGLTGTYASDPSTSKIEQHFGNHKGSNDFEAQKVDDGKLLTDKSVIYGGDDYNAFKEYKDGTFGVTLSALGQVFDTNTEVVKIPMDVLFVLDMSGSMTEKDTGQSKTRGQILVEAMNHTMDAIMKAHPDNRVCAVGFNSGSHELMELGRYTPNAAGEYLKYSNKVISTVTGGKSVTCYGGTYTQMGIAKGVEVMKRKSDTTYTTTINGEKVTVPRKPVMILVSDGEPTHCTSHYMDVLKNPYYGDGGGQEYNAKGIMGYYTILSANYYKRMVGIHYDNPASMYTVAFGMNENDFSHNIPDSDATNHYRATVMKPTAENIGILNTITTGYDADIEKMMYQLLNGIYKGTSVKVGAYRDKLGSLGSPHSFVPVIQKNDYRGNYNYADKAYLGNTGYKGIADAFKEIVDINSVITTEYSYETQSNTDIVVSDPVGDGMAVKGDPVLRYNGKNYIHTKKENQGSSVIYTYAGTIPMDPHSGRKIDLGKIKVKVDTDSKGLQTVTMSVPPKVLPVYTADRTTSFYYESLPVRAIYQVGLSKEGQTKVDTLKAGESLTFYTNRYTGGAHAKAAMSPTEKNKFYKGNQWPLSNNKSSNPTGTDTVSFNVQRQGADILQTLGNNGKLTYTKNQPDREISVQKKWLDYSGKETNEKLPEKITATLYRTYVDEYGKTIREDIVKDFILSEENGWKRTFTAEELKEETDREYLYYVTENTVEGYNVQYSGDGISENTPDNPILVTNRYRFGDFVLPESGGMGTGIFVVTGLALMALSLVSGYVLRRKRGERREL